MRAARWLLYLCLLQAAVMGLAAAFLLWLGLGYAEVPGSRIQVGSPDQVPAAIIVAIQATVLATASLFSARSMRMPRRRRIVKGLSLLLLLFLPVGTVAGLVTIAALEPPKIAGPTGHEPE